MTLATAPLTAARQVAPLLRAASPTIEAERELPAEVFAALADAGLYHLALPRSLGCPELDLPSHILVMEELGKADASAAWTVNQGAVFATFAARMEPAAARAIWLDVPRAVVANSPSPTARAEIVPGGYRVSGRQGFSTGCRHASWLAVHARIYQGEEMRLLPNGGPEARYLFVPVAEATIHDTWQVRGMRGTGTHHFSVEDVFVPEERTVWAEGAPLVEPGPLYRLPRTLHFATGDAAIALGVARSALDAFAELAGSKTPRRYHHLLRESALVQADVGHAEADLRSGRALLLEAARTIWQAAVEERLTLDERAELRLATTHAIRLAAAVVDRVYNAAGATAVYESHPLQRHFQDIHVITQHIQGRLSHYALAGRHWLGLDIETNEL